jgi:hypothetical protein
MARDWTTPVGETSDRGMVTYAQKIIDLLQFTYYVASILGPNLGR